MKDPGEPRSVPGGGTGRPSWWARGLLFENCNCTAVCPGHVHFSQPCTHEVCHGFWAVRIREGRAGDVSLDGLDLVVVYESPQVMIEGGWTQALVVPEHADPEQRAALESILSGRWGGPWEVLSRFVGERRPTRALPVRIEEEEGRKTVTVAGLLKGVVEALRGRDRSEPVLFENIYNQIHAPRQVIARGSTELDDGVLIIRTDGTHGLWSDFHWSGG